MKKIFTGALAFILFTGAAQAQTKDSARHGGKARQEMLTKQLNLTADQQSRLAAIRQEQRKEFESLKNNGSLSREELQVKRKELHKKYTEQAAAVYTPAQKEQLAKMKSEWKARHKEGSRDGKAKDRGGKRGHGADGALNLSQEQKSKMSELRTQFRSQAESIRNDKALTDAQKKEKMTVLRQQQQEQFKAVLTPEQVERMKSMKKDRQARNTK
ncbi:MAG TPA: hypothetical protein VFR58_01710 [Flavisolibacter sp.]|nr:hypothetical protein [Flavisolibacter sp.]